MINTLGIKEGDDLEFLKYGENTFILANKNDLVNMLTKANLGSAQEMQKTSAKAELSIEPRELDVLKKLDTLRYNDRTSTKVNSMLNADEKNTLQALIKKNMVRPFKKSNEKEVKYSIQKNVYDMFLYRKRNQTVAQGYIQKAKSQQAAPAARIASPKAWEQKLTGTEAYMDLLESKGFLVLNNEADATIVSAALEDSIRQGLVVGTRAFNKKFYIGLRGFINKNASKILKLIDQKSMNVEDIAKEADLEEDGVRTILYVLSESGDVTEVRRDMFRAA